MMKTLYNIIVVLAVLFSAGCYGDEGNYDYKDVNELAITFDKDGYNGAVGDVIEAKPTIRFVNGTGDLDRLKFKWFFSNGYAREDWNQMNFRWEADRLVSSDLCLEISDPVTGLTYIEFQSIQVRSLYSTEGILVLSEKDSRTQFSFIKITKTKFDADMYHAIGYQEFFDIYKTENDEDLPAGPIKLHQHFCSSISPGSILAMTKNGVVDMNGRDFHKEVVLEEKFDQGTYPAGVPFLSDAMFMKRVNLVTDPEGHVYRRLKNTSELFHSGEFLHRRLSMNNEVLTGCRLVLTRFNKLKGCLVYEEPKKRFLVISDSEAGGWESSTDEQAGFPLRIEDAAIAPEGFVQLSDVSGINLLSINYYDNSSFWTAMGYTMLFERENKLFCQNFQVEKEFGGAVYAVRAPEIAEVVGLPGRPTCIYSSCERDRNGLVFIAVGRKLFLFDRANPTLPVVEWGEFRADIVSMDGEMFAGRWLTVGLSDGSVLLLNAIKCGNQNSRYVYYDSMREMIKLPEGLGGEEEETPAPVTFGKIADVRLKIQMAGGWDISGEN